MSGIDEILAGYENLRPGQEDFYRYLHQHPELSHQEHQTAQHVAEKLRGDGFTVHDGIGGTGVTGVLANGNGPTVLLRCELDALPLRETTGAPFASTVTAKDAQGHEVPVDHACGHDMHMACMTTMATLMAARRDQWNGTLITLFQPAEETDEGAQEMVDDGLFTRIPVPDVALAQHMLPGIAGTVATCPGPFMSAACRRALAATSSPTTPSLSSTCAADRQRGLQQDPRRHSYPVLLLGHRVHRQADVPRGREGRDPGRPAHQPLAGVPAAAPAHLANRHRGPRRGRACLARAALRPDTAPTDRKRDA